MGSSRVIYTYVLVAIVSAAISGWGVWQVQNWRYGEKEAERIAQVLEDNRLNRVAEQKQAKTVIGAINAARQRETIARVDAAGAQSERDRLRNDLDKLKSDLPGLTADACRERAATVTELFDRCTDAYQGMAGKAQRHADDTLTLEQAWPK